ncbi:MAG: DUF1385 domain-containing protein [Acutalibacteraceae bacterium]|nr:DUF1385 domain-containing protein [Acutalibacteraceae bacterium]
MGEARKENIKKITSIGGSALIEGIMMRGPKKTMVAVRTDKDIYTEELEFHGLGEKFGIFKLPFIRGIAGMIDSMRLSYKALMISADKAIESIPEEENEKPSKFEKWLDEKLGDKMINVLMTLASVLGVAIAIVLFFMVPTWLYNLLSGAVGTNEQLSWMGDRFFRSLFEGVIRIGLFLLYIILCTQMSDMKRVFQYHGAEHKTIFCYESDEELTVENVKKHTRFHPRCGTSFIVIMLLLGIVIGLFIPITHPVLRTVVKLLLLPVTCGIGYELIKICGKYDNKLTRIIAAPGIWAQRITTKEPSDDMIEVAIKAMKAVIPENGEDIVNSK